MFSSQRIVFISRLFVGSSNNKISGSAKNFDIYAEYLFHRPKSGAILKTQ